MLVCVGIPSHDGRVCAETVDALLAETVLGYGQGIHFLVLWELGAGSIGIGRDRIAERFLAVKEADVLVNVDSDISWQAGTLTKLARRPEDVVGATYLSKGEGSRFHVDGVPERVGDMYRVGGLPGGFMKISRAALERMKVPRYEDQAGRINRNFFMTGIRDRRIFGEDYGFCYQWRQAGGEVWLDPSLIVRHHDGAIMYSGSPEEWLRDA